MDTLPAGSSTRPLESTPANGTGEEMSTASRPDAKQDPDPLDRGRAERGALVVVGEDAVVRPPVLRKSVRAPLGHTDAVAPSVALEDERICAEADPMRPNAERECGQRQEAAHEKARP